MVGLLVYLLLGMTSALYGAEKITIAAASDLKYAMDGIVTSFKKDHPDTVIDLVYGSSGKFMSQIEQGAPYDLFFAADISYPQALVSKNLAATEVKTFAIGRLVLWSARFDASRLTLEHLKDPKITRIAIANPKHAPYGQRAVEALQAAGVLDLVQPKLVYGENIAQAAQFVQSGNAQIGILALALVLHPDLAAQSGFALLPENLHKPLEQGFIITKRAKNSSLARSFATFFEGPTAQNHLKQCGFTLVGAGVTKKAM